jgi:hypothetical protein
VEARAKLSKELAGMYLMSSTEHSNLLRADFCTHRSALMSHMIRKLWFIHEALESSKDVARPITNIDDVHRRGLQVCGSGSTVLHVPWNDERF